MRTLLNIIIILVISSAVLIFGIQREKKTSAVYSLGLNEQQQKIVLLEKDVRFLKQQFDEQKNILAGEKNKRQQLEKENKIFKSAVFDINTRMDVINQDMKGWLKDYIAVLAGIDKRTAVSEKQLKDLWEKLNSENIADLNYKILTLQAAVDKIIK
ncbi:MAG: hypothetical protein HQL26_03090 [Candidatus Omnitrophica bacterium]|nr:hypothetical protein [Candidatus Omnitrophota bacterium]